MKSHHQVLILLGSLALIAAAQAQTKPTLLHRYSFNDGAVTDSVGHADGKLVGGATISDGQARFDGKAGERIELPAGTIAINALNSVTLEAWFTADKAVIFQRLFDFGGSTAGLGEKGGKGKNYFFYTPTSWFKDSRAVLQNATASAAGGGGTSPSEAAAKGKSVATGTETCVAITVDAATLTLFVDGVQVAQTPLGDRTLANVSNDFALLGASLFSSDAAFNGSINEFRIYGAAASPAQIKASFAVGPNG